MISSRINAKCCLCLGYVLIESTRTGSSLISCPSFPQEKEKEKKQNGRSRVDDPRRDLAHRSWPSCSLFPAIWKGIHGYTGSGYETGKTRRSRILQFLLKFPGNSVGEQTAGTCFQSSDRKISGTRRMQPRPVVGGSEIWGRLFKSFGSRVVQWLL